MSIPHPRWWASRTPEKLAFVMADTVFVAALPRNEMGKLAKHLVKAPYWDAANA